MRQASLSFTLPEIKGSEPVQKTNEQSERASQQIKTIKTGQRPRALDNTT